MTSRRWRWRAAGAAAAYVVLEVVFTIADFEPDPLRLALLVVAVVAGLGLVSDAFGHAAPPWPLEADVQPTPPVGDPRLTQYVSLVEAHLAARGTDRALRDRLAVLTEQALRQRHGLGRRDPGAADLLDAHLLDVIDGPPRRLGLDEIDRCLTTIEEL